MPVAADPRLLPRAKPEIKVNAVRNISSDSVLSFGRANGLIDLSVHSLPITRSFAGTALRMTLSAATLANAQLLAVRANTAIQYFVFSMISEPSINRN